MNPLKMTPLAALVAAALLSGCGREEPTASDTAGTTSTATGNSTTSPATGSAATTTGGSSTAANTTGTATPNSTSPGSTSGSATGAGTASGTGSTAGTASGGTSVAGGTGSSMGGSSAGATGTGTPSTTMSAGGAGSGAPLAMADKNFVTTAAVGGLFEVEAGKLAADKATDPAVKAYGKMLAEDHGKANDELKQIAQARNVPLPDQLPADKMKELDQLRKATGSKFDSLYVQKVGIEAHQADIRSFEKAAKDAKDPQLKSFAEKTLPTLREHLAQAKTLPGGGSQASTTGRATTAGADTRSPGATPSAGATNSAGASPSPGATPGGSTTATPAPSN